MATLEIHGTVQKNLTDKLAFQNMPLPCKKQIKAEGRVAMKRQKKNKIKFIIWETNMS